MAQFGSYSCLKVSVLCTSLLFLQQIYAQSDFAVVDQQLQQQQKQLGTNLVTMVYKDGRIIYEKALGDAKATTAIPLAFTSQWLTAALVMTFVEEGKLSLDDKVGKYLPIFNPYNKGYITIRHCLTHMTGIAGEKPGTLLSSFKRSKYASLEEEVNDFASKKDIETNAGTRFNFNNIGPNIAGRVLEVISKKSFDRLMTDRIFRPLAMKNSSFASDKAVNPSGGAVSSPLEFMNFLAMILNKGTLNGKKILSEQAVAEMQLVHINKTSADFDYGYGEWIQEKDDQGRATAICGPGLSGTWPWIDFQKGYAALVFAKTVPGEQKKEPYLQLKKTIEAALK